jgi:ABC-type nitrate/sulfonate/bicarbonate transport system substrate-binding protein
MRAALQALMFGVALAAMLNPAQAQTKLDIMVFQGVQNLPLFAAQTKGFFAKRGLEVEIKIAPSSDEMRDGLAEGRYQIVHGAVDNAVAMAEVAKKDIAVVNGGDNGFNELIVQPEIATYADLRGKAVVVDAINTAYAFQLYDMLAQNGRRSGAWRRCRTRATPPRCSTCRSRSGPNAPG